MQRARSRGRGRDLRDSDMIAENIETIDRVADRVANDVNALVRAWSAANAETVKGAVTIVGNIALDLLGRSAPGRRGRASAYRDDGDRDAYRDAYRDDRDPVYAPRRTTADRVEDVGDEVAGITHSLSDALAGAASVVSRSSRRFQEEYDSALDDAEQADRELGRVDTDPRDADGYEPGDDPGGDPRVTDPDRAAADIADAVDDARASARTPPRKRGG